MVTELVRFWLKYPFKTTASKDNDLTYEIILITNYLQMLITVKAKFVLHITALKQHSVVLLQGQIVLIKVSFTLAIPLLEGLLKSFSFYVEPLQKASI